MAFARERENNRMNMDAKEKIAEEIDNERRPRSLSLIEVQTPLSTSSHDEASTTSSSRASTVNGYSNSKIGNIKRLGMKSSTCAYRIREHVRLGSKFSETVKAKVSLGARIIREGGRENIFKHIFGFKEEEELLKASQCYLSTTAGPIAGLLFISTQKLAFCSERSISFRSPNGQLISAPYKVVIPVRKIKRVYQSENMNKPVQKYMEIVTEDNFEFWFMGFLRYEKAFLSLQKAISMAHSSQQQQISESQTLSQSQ